MPTYKLTYGRCVLLTRRIRARNEDHAWKKAAQMEKDGALGIETVEAKTDSEVDDIQDDESVWFMEED